MVKKQTDGTTAGDHGLNCAIRLTGVCMMSRIETDSLGQVEVPDEA